MAYDALVSVTNVIESILPHEQKYTFLCPKEKMESLHKIFVSLQEILEYYSRHCVSITYDQLESRMIDVSYQLEDMIKSYCISKSPSSSESLFGSYIKEVDSIMKDAMMIKEISKNKDVLVRDSQTSNPSRDSAPGRNGIKVGIKEDVAKIIGRATGHQRNLQIIPIVGMAGIGKTTLAKAVYVNPSMTNHFDVCFWATVSQEYNIKEILQSLLPRDQEHTRKDVGKLIELVHKSLKGHTEKDVHKLIVDVYQSLKGRRFLIVLDDMWQADAWDSVSTAFPNDNNGSCVIITTRLSELAASVDSSSPLHQMKFLNDDQSWELFRENVFGKVSCPPEFEEIGRTIAIRCKGLPLAVVAIAGLVKFNMSCDYWEEVERNVGRAAAEHDDQLMGVLSLSYINLPPHLKPCFLYMAAFREDYKIPAKKLIMLWVAEGFLKPRESKSTEEVAEECLEDLVERNLVLVEKKRSNGKIRTIMVHDVMRELSITKAQETKFLLRLTHEKIGGIRGKYKDFVKEIMKNQCRLSVFDNTTFCRLSKDTYRPIRSLIFHHELSMYNSELMEVDPSFNRLRVLEAMSNSELMEVDPSFNRLRVLEAIHVSPTSIVFSNILEITNLRYLHIFIGIMTIPESISNLQNLETLICSTTTGTRGNFILPSSIWKMPQLKHLISTGSTTFILPVSSLYQNYDVLDNLQSLSRVRNFMLTESTAKRIPDIKKLKISYMRESNDWSEFGLINFVELHNLEELKICSFWDGHEHWDLFDFGTYPKPCNIAFPKKLKMLTLSGTYIAWNKMSVIGSLPHLEMLKLLEKAFVGNEWVPIEGEFLELKYLKMVAPWGLKHWRAEETHFPCLETLIIKECRGLKEVPASIGHINTLQKLIIEKCNKYADQSVRVIQEEQHSYGNYELEIVINPRSNDEDDDDDGGGGGGGDDDEGSPSDSGGGGDDDDDEGSPSDSGGGGDDDDDDE